MNMQVSSSSAQGQSLRGATLDPKRFRSVMGTFATGVAVIATEWNGELFGATVNSQIFFVSEAAQTFFKDTCKRADGGLGVPPRSSPGLSRRPTLRSSRGSGFPDQLRRLAIALTQQFARAFLAARRKGCERFHDRDQVQQDLALDVGQITLPGMKQRIVIPR